MYHHLHLAYQILMIHELLSSQCCYSLFHPT